MQSMSALLRSFSTEMPTQQQKRRDFRERELAIAYLSVKKGPARPVNVSDGHEQSRLGDKAIEINGSITGH